MTTVTRAAAVLAAAAVLLGACGDGDGDDGGDDEGLGASTTGAGGDGGGTAPTGGAAEAPLDGIEITLTEVATVDTPTSLVTRPGSPTLYVTERAGRVRPLVDLVPGDPILDITDEVVTNSEQGLLDIEFSPDGNTLYVSYNVPEGGDTRIAAYALRGDTVDAASRRELLAVEQPFPNHKGGDIEIGPDGLLYIGLGDGGAGGDPQGNGQDTAALLGKLLRIDPTRAGGGTPYAIPDDNPFAQGGGAPEVYAYGLRNPWRFDFDEATGDLWIADVGQNEWEEIDLLPAGTAAGANLGWNEMEGSHPYEGGSAPAGAVAPVFEYSHDEGCSITGGVVYRGDHVPGLAGAYLFTDYCTSRIRAVRARDGQVTEQRVFDAEASELVSFAEGNEGELYVLSLSGEIYRIDPAGG
ncbi:MAG TPA: PQQ-dependent sugar dehydrogenase [Acidimicrobiales bacterium]|nr:PQQ-dependent sugar dehydrogenase [Acidimicrobiales bacterium]